MLAWGRVALELAIARPDLVDALVLVGSATPEALAAAPEMTVYTRSLMDAIAKGDLDAAVEVNVRTWVDGPHRAPKQVDPDLRARIAQMQRDAFINTRDYATTFREEPPVSDLAAQLAEIAAPMLVLAGHLDMDFIHDQARLLADRIPGARLTILPDTAHSPSIERTEAINDLVVPFLSEP